MNRLVKNRKDYLLSEGMGRYEADASEVTIHDNNSVYNYKPFFTGLALINTLIGKTPNEDDFIEVGVNALEKIGNVHTAYYGFIGRTDKKGELCLPTVAQSIEYVSNGREDFTSWSNATDVNQLYAPGGYVAYKFLGDKIKTNYFEQTLSVLYKTTRLDEKGLPAVTPREAEAMAYWWNYTDITRRYWRGEQLAESRMMEALRLANIRINQARIPEKYSQNFINMLHDIVYSRDGKIYNKSLKMIKGA